MVVVVERSRDVFIVAVARLSVRGYDMQSIPPS